VNDQNHQSFYDVGTDAIGAGDSIVAGFDAYSVTDSGTITYIDGVASSTDSFTVLDSHSIRKSLDVELGFHQDCDGCP
jgi:hypothetical protein